MRRITGWQLVGIASVGIALSACSSTGGSTRPAQSPEDSPVARATITAPTQSAPATVIEGDEPQPLNSPTNDVQSQRTATVLAVEAMTAFARPDVAEALWWADLSPLLSNQARQAYKATDPAHVPAHRITGPARLLPSATGYLAEAVVPTDVGSYRVLMSRPGQNAPWSVERFKPPAVVR